MLPAATVLGLLAGFAGNRAKDSTPAVGTSGNSLADLASDRSASAGDTLTKPPAGMKSSDTPGELLAIVDAEELYARLALWLLDAPEEDLAAFWTAYRKRENRDPELVALVFSQWTRTNPLAARDAAKDSGHENAMWWAWAINDPDAAILAVRGASKEMGGSVMRAIGQFHPDRVMQVLEENPGFADWNGIGGIVDGLSRTDPEAALAFQQKHGQLQNTGVIEKLTRDDPHAALEWLRTQPGGAHSPSEAAFIRTLEREKPEMLAELAATAPSGPLKWKLESAAFRHLARTNPAEALVQARAAGSPRVVAERLAAVGSGMTTGNPAKALEIFQELFKACPDATHRGFLTRYPGYFPDDGNSVPIAGVHSFITGLVANEPQAAMDIVAQGVDGAALEREGEGSALTVVARSWAKQDRAGFGGWLGDQQAGPVFDQGAKILVEQLAEAGEFAEAFDWSARLTDQGSRWSSTRFAFQQWQEKDPETAGEWIEKNELSDDQRKALQPYLRDQ